MVRDEDLFCMFHFLHVHWKAGKLHLNDVKDGVFEQSFVNLPLLVGIQGGLVLLLYEPSGESVDEVVLEKIGQGDAGDVLDVALGIIPSEFLGLLLETELVSSTGVGRQIGDELGTVP